jgi:Protein of unknown function (DUF3237)
MAIELEPLGEFRIVIREQLRLDGAAFGTRVIGTAERCEWVGGPITATQIDPPANDWLTVDDSGHGQVDARMVMRTDDGATILVRYGGRLTYTPEGASVVTAPTFETNDDRYRWLNHVQAIAKGRREGPVLVYELYAVR